MGNCMDTSEKKSAAEIAPSDVIIKPPPSPPLPSITLYGQAESFATSHVRLALQYKPVAAEFVPSETHQNPTLIYQSDVVSGSVDDILAYLDSKFPHPPVRTAAGAPSADSADAAKGSGGGIWGWSGGDKTPVVVRVVAMQHKGILWHLDKMVEWAEEMEARGGKMAPSTPARGTPRMEVKKMAKRYGWLYQVMVEHAQMEETVLFQILESADRGLCKGANEQHGRDLPIMNGIKEEIKIIGVMNIGSPDYQEALSRLTSRLRKLKENCKQHFAEEERDLMPLMEATELNKSQQEKVLKQSLDVMRETHSHMFRFFVEGLCPQEAMNYFELIKRYCDNVRVSLMHHMMVDG